MCCMLKFSSVTIITEVILQLIWKLLLITI